MTGRRAATCSSEWADGARAYLGMTVPGFPNLFLVYGPNTNLGGSSILSMIECQTGYLGQAAELLATGGPDGVEVRRDVAERYDHEIQERLAGSRLDRRVPRAGTSADGGRVTTNWPGLVRGVPRADRDVPGRRLLRCEAGAGDRLAATEESP